jgi:hypothetical protein
MQVRSDRCAGAADILGLHLDEADQLKRIPIPFEARQRVGETTKIEQNLDRVASCLGVLQRPGVVAS